MSAAPKPIVIPPAGGSPKIKLAPGRAIPPLIVRASKAQLNVVRAVGISGSSDLIRDALEERGADRVSEAKRSTTEAERESNLDIAAELFTLARLA